MSKKKGLVPERRFSEFRDKGDWQISKLKHLAKRTTQRNLDSGETRVLTNSAQYGVVDQRDYFDKDIANQSNLGGYYIVEEGDYVYNPRVSIIASVGPISKNKIAKGVMSPLYTVFRFNNKINDFYEQYFKSTRWHHYLQVVSNSGARHDRMSISNDVFMSMPVPVTEPEEQQKITDCFTSIDELIVNQVNNVESLKAYKKGLIQQLFPAEGKTVPKLRFPEFQEAGDWGKKLLSELLFETKHRNRDLKYGPQNVLSVSGEYGCVNQIEFKGRSYAGVSVKDYHVVETGDIVYTKSPLKNNPFGIIKENRGKTGIVSTLYAVYRVTDIAHPEYLGQYFSRDFHVNSYLQPIVNKGAKNDMKVNNSDVLNGKIPIPKKEEQQKIAACLTSIDELITNQTQKIATLKLHKKGLLQQLFPVMDEVNV